MTGLSVAFHLGREGVRDVVVVDKVGVGAGASGIQPGGVRQQWGSRVNCMLAKESYAFYRDASAHLALAVPATLDRGGYLFVAFQGATLDRLDRNRSLQNECGIPSVTLSSEEVADLVPGLDAAELLGGSFCAEDGYFDRPQAVLAGFASSAVAHGAVIEELDVVTMRPDGSGWIIVGSGGTGVRSEHVVVAAGCDSPGLLAPLGVELPIESEARHLFFSDPIRERLLEPLVVSPDQQLAAKQLADGSVLASDLSATGSAAETPEWRARIRSELAILLPILDYVTFPVHVQGQYDLTPDRQAILGAVDGMPGLWLATGLSGRGFMMAPAVGRLLADAIVHNRFDELLASLSVTRFAENSLTPEPQVV